MEAIRRQSEKVNGGPARPIRERLMLLFGLRQQRGKKKNLREETRENTGEGEAALTEERRKLV